MTAVTILELAEHRLGRHARNGADFADAGLPIMGGCERCGATVAAYNSHPSRSGYLRCGGCIGDDGWTDVAEADRAVFEDEAVTA